MKKISVLIAVLLTGLLAVGACAESVFEGSVVSRETACVVAPFGGVVDSVNISAGERVARGDTVATIETTLVYAPVEGKIAGVFAAEGDSIEGIVERYGAVMYIEPVNKYTIAATTEKAYNVSENKFIHIGETVYLCCTADGSHTGVGRVTSVGEEGKYSVEVTGGEFCIEETVGVFRRADYASVSRIGRGAVAATPPVAVKGSGSVIKMHVRNGDSVERGELIYESVNGALDGLYAPGANVVSTVTGIVSSVDAGAGAAVEKGGKIITVYPDEALTVEVPVYEGDLSDIQVGMNVVIEFSWDPEQQTRFDGVVDHISYVNSAESGEPIYIATIDFTPDENVRLGMTVIVYTVSAEPETDVPETDETDGD